MLSSHGYTHNTGCLQRNARGYPISQEQLNIISELFAITLPRLGSAHAQRGRKSLCVPPSRRSSARLLHQQLTTVRLTGQSRQRLTTRLPSPL